MGINLNFAKIIRVKMKKNFDDPIEQITYFNELFSKLPVYKRGNFRKRSKGYLNLSVSTSGRFSILSEGNSKKLLITKRYIHEDYGTITTIDFNGNERLSYFPKHQITNIFWLFPDLMLIMGPKDDSEQSFETLVELLENDIELELIKFPHDFFMWLECQYILNEGIVDEDLKIIKVEDDDTENPKLRTNRSGYQTTVKGSDDAILSSPTLSALAAGHNLKSVKMNFELDDVMGKYRISATLSQLEGIFIYRRYVNFSKDENSKFLYSLIFLRKIFEVYNSWLELPREKRCPSKECFEKMRKEMTNQSLDGIDFFDKVIESYKTKSDEEVMNESTLEESSSDEPALDKVT